MINTRKTAVGSSIPEYDDFYPIWRRTRAVLGGERAAKEHDAVLDSVDFSNLLIPFSPSMTPAQYRWYLAEAELPGMTSQYSKVLLGGLLRKPPSIVLPPSIPEEAMTWINSGFTEDNRPILAFLDEAVYEELCTSRCWISVDYPVVENYESMSPEERAAIVPYPVVWRAEDVINWQTAYDYAESKPKLSRVVFRYLDRDFSENPYHSDFLITVMDCAIDENGHYRIQYYQRTTEADVDVTNGRLDMSPHGSQDLYGEGEWVPVGEPIYPTIAGEPMTELPIWPLNGEIDLRPPLLTPLIDKEVALYNKMSRRNHLLYGASTYTPILKSDMLPEDFEAIVSRGLGSWIQIGKDDTIDVLTTPVEALTDLDRAIEAAASEMANLGTRLLSPDFAESGIAMQIRNAPQTAQLGTLNSRLSSTMKQVIATMLHWRYGTPIDPSEVEFTLSDDFNSGALSQDAAYMLTEWYQSRLIPRSVWLQSIKKLELIPSDYDDVEGQNEISKDTLLMEGQEPIMEEG